MEFIREMSYVAFLNNFFKKNPLIAETKSGEENLSA